MASIEDVHLNATFTVVMLDRLPDSALLRGSVLALALEDIGCDELVN
jgi:hypothetical protein